MTDGQTRHEFEQLPVLIQGMDFPTYLADPAPKPSITSSIVRELLSTAPRAVWERTPRLNPDHEETKEKKFALGTAAHAQFIGEGEPIVVVYAKTFQSNAAKEERDAAYAAGQTPVLEKDMDRVERMAEEAREQFGRHRDIGPVLQREELVREGNIFWQDRGGVYARCRPDLYLPGVHENRQFDDPQPIIIHYKTTGTTVHPSYMARFAVNQGWDMIAAHYHAGVAALTGVDPVQYFAIQETEPPYLCMVLSLDDRFLEVAMRRRQRALYIWSHCLNEGVWPGHYDGTIKLGIPPWHENAMQEQMDEEKAMADAGADMLERMMRWQAPLTRMTE